IKNRTDRHNRARSRLRLPLIVGFPITREHMEIAALIKKTFSVNLKLDAVDAHGLRSKIGLKQHPLIPQAHIRRMAARRATGHNGAIAVVCGQPAEVEELPG